MHSIAILADTILTGLFTILVCIIPVILTTSLVYKRMFRFDTLARSSSGDANNMDAEDDSLYDCTQQQADRDASLRQIYHITFLLRQRLNVDVARIVMSHTELYEVYRQRRRPNDPLHIMEFNSPQPCFVGTAIQARARVQHPVRRVTFRLESRDQGWVTDRNSGSWTWFTVGVLPASGENVSNDTDYDQTDLMFNAPGMYHGDDANNDRDREYGRQNPIFDSLVRERELYRNDVGCRHFQVKTVTWDSDSEIEEEAAWVRSLQRGDRIVVRAWAQFAGWQNSVRCTSVSIFNTPLA